MKANQLTVTESKRLAAYEQTIGDGLLNWIDVSRALIGVREEQLYRAKYERFEDYCQGRWGFGRSYASRLITAMEAADDVSEVLVNIGVNKMVTMVTPSERVAREIAKVESETDRADLWVEACSTATKHKQTGLPNPTASHVARTRREMFGQGPRSKASEIDQVRALMKKVNAVQDAIADLQPAYRSESASWQTALEALEFGRKALERLTK